jgi:hypothetical protein
MSVKVRSMGKALSSNVKCIQLLWTIKWLAPMFRILEGLD